MKVQTHYMCCIKPFCQRIEENKEFELFEELLLFPDFAAGLQELVGVEYFNGHTMMILACLAINGLPANFSVLNLNTVSS